MTKKNIEKLYAEICKREGLKVLPLFWRDLKGHIAECTFNDKKEPVSIAIDPSVCKDVFMALYHEVAHQVCLNRWKDSSHNKRFSKELGRLIEKYAYSKLEIKYSKTMKLDTGSVMNRIANSKGPDPMPGMGATMLMWSDRRAYTIHAVELDGRVKKLWASPDTAERIDSNGAFTEAHYSYSNEDAQVPERWRLFTLRKDGRWHEGRTLKGSILAIGYRRHYVDPTF